MRSYEDAFNGLYARKEDIYNLVAENAIRICSFASVEGIVDKESVDEFHTQLKSNMSGDHRKWFHIFTGPVLKINDKSYEKLKGNARQEVPLHKLRAIYRTLSGKFLPADITNTISPIYSTSSIMTEAFNIRAHGEIDAGLLILVSANILRLIETSPAESLSKIGDETTLSLKELAGYIFSDKLNFKFVYLPVDDEEPEGEQVTRKDLALPSNEIADVLKYTVKPLLDKQAEDISTTLKGEISFLFQDQVDVISLLMAQLRTKGEIDGVYTFSEGPDYPSIEELELLDTVLSGVDSKPTLISYSQAEDKLLGVRNEISAEWQSGDKWPGDFENWHNILQRKPIVEEMKKHHVKSLDEWKSVPSIAARYKKYEDIMDAQIDEYWESQIQPILDRIQSSS